MLLPVGVEQGENQTVLKEGSNYHETLKDQKAVDTRAW